MFNKSNSYTKYVVAFTAFAFTLIQGVDFVLLKLGIDTNYLQYLLLPLLLAFFIGLIFIWKNQKTKAPNAEAKPKRKWTLYLNVFMTVVLGGLFVYYFQIGRTHESLLNEKLPEIINAYDNDDWDTVYNETKLLIDEGNENPIIESYYSKVTTSVSIHSEPKDVEVSLRRTRDSTGTWQNLGKTPLENIRIPRASLQLEFRTQGKHYTEYTNTYSLDNGYNHFILPKADSKLQDHVVFAGGNTKLSYPILDHLPAITIGPYSISQFEVTNKDFKEFVDAGGYRSPEYWDFPYTAEGKALTFDETVKTFTGQFGELGPSVWTYGSYPEGQENYPVTGISWFEASAYANYQGLSLPNLYQWTNAAMLSWSSSFVPLSNFSKNQLVEVGSMESKNPKGIYDIAGNAREWILNSVDEEHSKKAILGGGFEDDPYYFNDYFGQSVLDRSSSNGVRLVSNMDGDVVLDSSPEAVVSIPMRDFLNEETVSDDVFEIFKAQYDYPEKPLNDRVKTESTTSGTFKVDRFEISSPYEKDGILPGYIFYDSVYTKPFKPVILFPGSNAIHHTDIENMHKRTLNRMRYLISDGYAVFLPVYLSTYERKDELNSDYPTETDFYKEHMIKWGKEYKRTLDYIVSRKDMDASNISYYGISWGGYMSNVLLAIDDRVKSATLSVAGLCFQKSKKEVEAYHYTSRITMPVLMLNGEFDQFFPLETSQIPMFKLLGTKAEDKKHYVSKTGHFVPEEVLIREHLAWLKKYEN